MCMTPDVRKVARDFCKVETSLGLGTEHHPISQRMSKESDRAPLRPLGMVQMQRLVHMTGWHLFGVPYPCCIPLVLFPVVVLLSQELLLSYFKFPRKDTIGAPRTYLFCVALNSFRLHNQMEKVCIGWTLRSLVHWVEFLFCWHRVCLSMFWQSTIHLPFHPIQSYVSMRWFQQCLGCAPMAGSPPLVFWSAFQPVHPSDVMDGPMFFPSFHPTGSVFLLFSLTSTWDERQGLLFHVGG
mmetsp:Transcript_7594/g.46761  ORF Transcript_7594/g.46761 Transcript_7594/m.46761 type:complete len:239 (+) Transcript_7594:1570-2286(+)